MKTSIIKKDFWTSDEFVEMHLDTKFMYIYLLSCPDKGYITVFKFNKHLAMLCTGMSGHSIERGVEELGEKAYIEIFNGYVGLLRADSSSVGGMYGGANKDRELSSLPVNVREHFGLDDDSIIEEPTKKVPKKTGPPPETIKSILAKQPKGLRTTLVDFIEDRKERNKAPTTRAVKGWIVKLEKMYPNQIEKQAACLQQSIDRGWMGLFEIKDSERSESSFL